MNKMVCPDGRIRCGKLNPKNVKRMCIVNIFDSSFRVSELNRRRHNENIDFLYLIKEANVLI